MTLKTVSKYLKKIFPEPQIRFFFLPHKFRLFQIFKVRRQPTYSLADPWLVLNLVFCRVVYGVLDIGISYTHLRVFKSPNSLLIYKVHQLLYTM
jgi:hypothetical protein